jgi:hypothetical protein
MSERKDEEQDQPLSSEALRRAEWRGDDAPPSEEERDAGEVKTADRPNPLAGTMLPPD